MPHRFTSYPSLADASRLATLCAPAERWSSALRQICALGLLGAAGMGCSSGSGGEGSRVDASTSTDASSELDTSSEDAGRDPLPDTDGGEPSAGERPDAGIDVSEPDPGANLLDGGDGAPENDAGGAPIGNEAECRGDAVCRALTALGVDATNNPRLDADGEPLPETFHPLGSKRRRLRGAAEFYLAGARLFQLTSIVQTAEVALVSPWDETVEHTPQLLFEFEDPTWTQAEWHAGTSGDVDGDGFDDVIGVWNRAGELVLTTIGELQETPVQTDTLLGYADPGPLQIVAGDFDGDGLHEVVVSVSSTTDARLLFVDDFAQGFATRELATHPRVDANSRSNVVLAAGTIDYDAADELVVVLNEATDWQAVPPRASSRFVVYDDAATDFVELLRAPMIASADGASRVGLSGGAAVVDVDGDGVGEVVLAGIVGTTANDTLGHVLFTLDDAPRGLSMQTARYFESTGRLDIAPYDQFPFVYETVFVRGLDIDGDARKEILVNTHIFANFADGRFVEPWTVRAQIDPELLFYGVGETAVDYSITARNMALSSADLTGDGRDDLALLSHGGHLALFDTLGDVDPVAIETPVMPTIAYDLENNEGLSNTPLLLPLNISRDATLVEFDPSQSGVFFTEPIVVAALAAPPCGRDIGQNLEECRTSYGKAESQEVTFENSVTLSASATLGVSIEERVFTQSALEATFTAHISASLSEGETHSVEKSIVYTTGALEDAVVFTTIPYDRYAYRVIWNNTPELVEETVFVDLPRSLVTLMVERSFYNDNIVAGGDAIDERVLGHTPGDPTSYPSAFERDTLLRATTGLTSDTTSVSQGSGGVEVALEVGEAHSQGGELAIGFEASVQVTAGAVLTGFTVGYEMSSSLTISSGESTTYAGGVGAIDAEHFAANQYDFGLFSYIHTAPSGRKFEVVNYWVE